MDNREIRPVNSEVIRGRTIRDLADDGGRYTLLSRLQLTPGFNPASEYSGVSYPDFPLDRYSTSVELDTGCIISVEKRSKPLDQQTAALPQPRRRSRLLSLFGKRDNSPAIPVSENFLYGVHAQIGLKPAANDGYVFKTPEADVWCSPNELPQELQRHIETRQLITLEKSLLIKPDYSNLTQRLGGKIVTTEDYYSILIKAGAKVSIQRGGSIGNIIVHIDEGSLLIPCNPNIKVPPVRKNK